MTLFGGILSIHAVTFLMFSIFSIAAVGYAFGRIEVKGIELGTAGVFIIALIYGCFLYRVLDAQLTAAGTSYTASALKIIENMGLVLFVSSVGFIAGPNFFDNLKKNFKSYVVLGLVIIVSGGLACALCIILERKLTGAADAESLSHITSMLVGILAGALTSTPAFSASKEAVGADFESIVAVGYGIAYLFGVIGVVLFVQVIPKLVHADMAAERERLVAAAQAEHKEYAGKTVDIDSFGFFPFVAAATIGIFIGSFKFGSFSLTTTGGCLLSALVFGHFRHIGPVSIMPKGGTLKVCRELGLALFLIGAGISGGANFVEHFKPIYFLYGVIMTLLPLILGYLFARFVLRLCLLNNLGSITGGMTSTPALGTLIHVAGTEDAAAAYAATYPIALISVVLVSQILIIVF
ncbi:MAG: permease [Treponemataceae bacterium]|nr:permease [Treponemataceae bacterium]